jgi:hypothetical protein
MLLHPPRPVDAVADALPPLADVDHQVEIVAAGLASRRY